MKTKSQTETNADPSLNSTFATACLASCQKILAQIDESRKAIIAEVTARLEVPDQLLRLAINEAEALAWQTGFPHLVFPVLAAEKARSVANWHSHQQAIRQPSSHMLRAA